MLKLLFFIIAVSACAPAQNINNAPAKKGASVQKKTSYSRPSSFFRRTYSSFDIINQDGNRIANMLGEPHLKRFDYPTEIWLYQREKGTLFVFLEQTSSGSVVSFVEAREKTSDEKIDTDEFLRKYF